MKSYEFTEKQRQTFQKLPEEQRQIYKWMLTYYSEYEGPTQLAEAAADNFDHDEWLDGETHWIWDLAVDFYEMI